MHTPAKTNFYLTVGRERECDHRHEIRTLFVPVSSLADEVSVRPSPTPGITVECTGRPITGLSTPEDNLAVRAAEHTDTEQLAQRIMRTLDRETGTRGQFETENLAMQKSRLNSLMHIVTLILTVISGISLLVSGLGIMTIMLVSVHERVREIGIKKAIGAPRSRILAEFLAESAVLSLLGSVAGLAVGLGVSWAGLSAFHMPFAPEGGRMLLLVLFCIAIGALFGVYPALQAARMRPVDALRQE